jgi:lysophospholipid acyltransferase
MLISYAGGRRLVRPFFFTPDGSTPTQYKRYYDIFTWFITQFAFSFTTAPFLLLSLSSSLLVWSRVYFYAVIGFAVCQGFMVSPYKNVLAKRLKEYNKPVREGIQRTNSTEDGIRKAPTLGLPDDPEQEMNEIVEEVKREIEERRRKGSVVKKGDITKAVEEKVADKYR